MAVLRGHADKRTAEQRRNDVAQKARPKGAQDKTTVTTGQATAKQTGGRISRRHLHRRTCL